jgi:hypothetical protein
LLSGIGLAAGTDVKLKIVTASIVPSHQPFYGMGFGTVL